MAGNDRASLWERAAAQAEATPSVLGMDRRIGPGGGFDPERTRAELPRFEQAPASPGEHTLDYLLHYGIDFADGEREHRVGTFEVDGETLVGHLILPRDAVGTAFVIHGYFDHVGLYGHLFRYCLSRGLAVATLDLPGHGLSTGRAASIESFDRYVRAYRGLRTLVEPLVPAPWHLFGQSMGGAIAMAHLLDAGYTAANAPYRNIVLFAPLVRPYMWTRLRFIYHSLRWFLGEWPRTFSGNSNDPGFTEFLRDADPLQAKAVAVPWVTAMVQWMKRFDRQPRTDLPLLVLQGDDDETVDAEHNLARISGKFAADTQWLPGAKHHLVNEAAEIRGAMFTHVDRRWRG